MIPGFDVTEFLRTTAPIVGLLVVAGIIFAESGLLIGFFLPGDSLLFTVGILAQQGVFGSISIHLIVILMFISAAAGDSVGYAFGNKIGRKLFKRPKSILFHPDNIVRAEAFYKRYGPRAIVLARFIPVIRTFAPIVAGVGKMRYRTFLTYNLIGALIWGAGITYIGYFVGSYFESRGVNIDSYLLPALAVIIVVSFLPPVYHIFKKPENREQLLNKIQKLFKR